MLRVINSCTNFSRFTLLGSLSMDTECEKELSAGQIVSQSQLVRSHVRY